MLRRSSSRISFDESSLTGRSSNNGENNEYGEGRSKVNSKGRRVSDKKQEIILQLFSMYCVYTILSLNSLHHDKFYFSSSMCVFFRRRQDLHHSSPDIPNLGTRFTSPFFCYKSFTLNAQTMANNKRTCTSE
jgi:hypothetical protein